MLRLMEKKMVSRKIISFIMLSCFVLFFIFILQSFYFNYDIRKIYSALIEDFVTLPNLDLKPGNSIFFMETSERNYLTIKEVCAVEAAAKAHSPISKSEPNATVYVLLLSKTLKNTSRMREVVNFYKNIEFFRFNHEDFLLKTPLKDWYERKQWKNSQWITVSLSDAFRLVVLWLFGGIYLDLDVITVKNYFDSKQNMLGFESEKHVATGVLKFDSRNEIIEAYLKDMGRNFDGYKWGANGPKMLSKILKERCGLTYSGSKKGQSSVPKCSNLRVLNEDAFYFIPYWNYELYIKENETVIQEILSNPHIKALHYWNHMLSVHNKNKLKLPISKNIPLTALALKYCPITIRGVDDFFTDKII